MSEKAFEELRRKLLEAYEDCVRSLEELKKRAVEMLKLLEEGEVRSR